MFAALFVISIELLLILILLLLAIFFLSMVISDLFGAPFVPTTGKAVHHIFDDIKLKKSDIFYDLGCGDGRLVFFIAKKYGAKAIGVERNPILHFYSQLKKRVTKAENVEFIRGNIYDTNLSNATVIYLFLFPQFLVKLAPKIMKECKKGTSVISHGFRFKTWDRKLVRTRVEHPFPTYYYKT